MKELPPGMKVEDIPGRGIAYVYNGNIIFYWYKDDNVGRKQVWEWYHKNFIENKE